MGYAVTWCAVREEQAEGFLKLLGLSPTGATEDFPRSLLLSARLNTGWRVIWYGKYGCPFLRTEDLRRLSIERDILMCLVEEHVMVSSAELWSGGLRRWWITHEGEDGPKGLGTDGQLPSSFEPIREEMERLQAVEGGLEGGVDFIFEVPLKVAQTIVGFKHDEDSPHMSDGHFVVLDRSRSEKGWLRRLMG